MNQEVKQGQWLAEDFKSHFSEKLPDQELEAALADLRNIHPDRLRVAQAYSASGSLASLVFYVRATCRINDGKSFSGSAWGVSFPGGGALFGDVYLEDGVSLEVLYQDTVSFKFIATPVYTTFLFYNSAGNLLGHFQAGSVSTVSGTGAGEGRWS